MTPDRQPSSDAASPKSIGLLPWGDVIEDFLDEIDVSLEDFCTKMTGGWLFGYIDALRLQGIRTTVFCFTNRVDKTVRKLHEPSGSEFVLMKSPWAYRWVRRYTKDPYGLSAEQMFGSETRLSRGFYRVAHLITPYLATPICALARELRRANCQAILCQEYESPRFDASIAIGALVRIPVFATFQGGSWHRSGLERTLRPLSLRLCAGLIIGSSNEYARVKQQYGVSAEKIEKVFNPMSVMESEPRSREDARATLGLPLATRIAIWHGRVDVHTKGLDVLLAAWQQVGLQRPNSDFLLVLVGSGSGADALQGEIDRLAMRNIRWIREYILDRNRIRTYLAASDLYVFPSRREGFPVAPLEAMACGLPVIASAAPGISDIFDRGEEAGGIIVPVGDVPALVTNLIRLLDDQQTSNELGMRAERRVRDAFSLQSVGTQLRSCLFGAT